MSSAALACGPVSAGGRHACREELRGANATRALDHDLRGDLDRRRRAPGASISKARISVTRVASGDELVVGTPDRCRSGAHSRRSGSAGSGRGSAADRPTARRAGSSPRHARPRTMIRSLSITCSAVGARRRAGPAAASRPARRRCGQVEGGRRRGAAGREPTRQKDQQEAR